MAAGGGRPHHIGEPHTRETSVLEDQKEQSRESENNASAHQKSHLTRALR
jgi:hypothetical protein